MSLKKRFLSLILSFFFLTLSFSQVNAAIVTNAQILEHTQQDNEQQALLQTIQRQDVQEQLIKLGVSPADIKSRISQMTHEEIAMLNQNIEQLPAGGDILGIAVLIFIVFVITDVIGATDIFPFIHPVK